MSDYWGMPDEEFELSLFQFARNEMEDMGYSLVSERVEVCSGAGALTLTAIMRKNNKLFGLYLSDGPKLRKTRGPPVIRILRVLNGMKSADDLRGFVLSHQHDFHIALEPVDFDLEKIEEDVKKIYSNLYFTRVIDLYKNNLSGAADILKKRLRKVTELQSGYE